MAQLQGQISAELADTLLDHMLGTAEYAKPETVYLALYEDDPTDLDVGTELSVEGYARQAVAFSAASGGIATNTGDIEFGRFAAAVSVSHWGLRDAETDGMLLWRGPLVDDATLGAADTRFDITKTGSLVTYTYDGTGTDPAITETNPLPGDVVVIASSNFAPANTGRFTVVTSGTNYFTVENADGIAEADVTVGAGGAITRLTPVVVDLPSKSKLIIEAGDMSIRLD